MSGYTEYPFPSGFESPKQKELDSYGLQYVKAAYYSTNRYGLNLQGDQRFDFLTEIAQGRQSVQNVRQSLGFFGPSQNFGPNEDNQSLAFLDVQILNMAPKYIQKAVAKIRRYHYDIDCAVIDPLSVNKEKQFQAAVKAFYALKETYETLGMDAQQFFDFDITEMPEYSDELMLRAHTNIKIQKAIDVQKTIKLLHEINRVGQVMQQYAWDLVVYGIGHLHAYPDENGIARLERVNPKYWFGSYVDNEDYSRQEYAGFVDFLTVNQFRSEAEDYLSDENIHKVIQAHAYPSSQITYNSVIRDYTSYDGLKYIPVVRFYFLSNDKRAYEAWTSQQGGPMLEERPYTYNGNKKKATEQDGRMIRNTVTSVYGGSWPVNSEVVYRYGRKERPRSNLVNINLPIVTFAPSQRNGRVVSLCAQMVELLFMVNVCWNRTKDILASGFKGIQEIDFSALEGIDLGRGGKAWTPRDVYEHMLKTRRLIRRTQLNQYQQPTGPAIVEGRLGIDLVDYITMINLCIRFLDDLTGTSVVEQAQLPDRLTSGVMQQNIAAANESMQYLVNAYEQGYLQSSHQLLLITQATKQNGGQVRGLIPALGTSNTEAFEVPDHLAYSEFGLYLSRQPSPEEWQDFYQNELAVALKNGQITAADSAFIRSLGNLKEARIVLSIREENNKRMAQKEQQQQMQFQQQMGVDSDARKAQMAKDERAEQLAQQQELIILQARINDAAIEKKARLDAEMKGMQGSIDAMIEKQKGIDTVIKEAMRSRSENYKSDKKHEEGITTARIQQETQIATAAIKAKTDKEKAKKKPVIAK